MAPRETQYLERFRESLPDWTDERFISRKELEALAMFSLYLVNLSEAGGWSYYGHSWKQGSPLGCLVVKADIDGTPQVVFTSATSYTGSIVHFVRKLENDLLEWRPDQYRG